MNESIGYTVTLNIMIVFIVIIFFFITGTFIYFKENKTNNIITDAIERHEGYNKLAQSEIDKKIANIGYNKNKITCAASVKEKNNSAVTCSLNGNKGSDGYCIYLCTSIDGDGEPYYYYKVRTNAQLNIPILQNIINLPIYTNTIKFYDFETKFGK